jgi:hypothetical protein
VREVPVDGEGLTDPRPLHCDEAQTVHEAVVLVGVSGEEIERFAFLLGGGAMNSAESPSEELLSDRDSQAVPLGRVGLSTSLEECDRLSHDMVRRHDQPTESLSLEGLEDVCDTEVIRVA